MCDKGMLEMNLDLIKLDYCIAINTDIQEEIVKKISELIEEEVYISSPKIGEYPTNDTHTIIVSTKIPRKWDSEVVRFSLQQMPGCCGVLISYHTQVYSSYQGKGINTFLQSIKEKIARENGYTSLLATTIEKNEAERHILEKNGWRAVDSFVNSRTGNRVIYYTKTLGKE